MLKNLPESEKQTQEEQPKDIYLKAEKQLTLINAKSVI